MEMHDSDGIPIKHILVVVKLEINSPLCCVVVTQHRLD
jgi:hypothetical protein